MGGRTHIRSPSPSSRRGTPFFYSGFISAGLWSLWALWRRRQPGRSLRQTAPAGHLITLAGFGLFGVGGVGDLLRHEIFGIEANVEALLSPTHLLLMVGSAIALSAPLRTMLRSSATVVSWNEFLPTLLSLTLLTAVGAFFLGYLSPFGTTAAQFSNATTHTHDLSRLTPAIAAELRENWALGSFLVTSIVLVLPAVFVRRHWQTARGTFLLLYGFLFLLYAGTSDFEQWPVIGAGLVVGIVVDASIQHRLPAWLLGASIPISVWSIYFLVFELQRGLAWSPELWVGVTLISGLLGGLMGALATDWSRVDKA